MDLLFFKVSLFTMSMSKESKSFVPTAISTWNFGKLAIKGAQLVLDGKGTAVEAVEKGINLVELDVTDQYFVGRGGYPNADGVMELDAAIMDHDVRYGAVMSLPDIAQPISVARRIMEECQHNILTGQGALKYSLEQGFSRENILTGQVQREWLEWKTTQSVLKPEDAHDTVGLICMDDQGRLAAGTSTSG